MSDRSREASEHGSRWVRIVGSHPAPTEAALGAAEAALGVTLPADYRALLRRSNGGRPEPPTFRPLGATEPTEVMGELLAVGGEPDLVAEARAYHRRLPPGLLPIAFDAFGNLICLGVAGPAAGQVFFWDHEDEAPDGPPSLESVRLIANSLDDFLSSFAPTA